MRRPRRLVRYTATVALAMTACVTARAEIGEPLFLIPVEQSGTLVASDADRPLRLALEAADLPALQRALGRRVVKVDGSGRVEILLDAYVPADDVPARDWLGATFLVDYDEAPVAELVTQLRAQVARPQRADVVAFAARTVQGSFDRGLDIASQVARNRHGDCTEFAVLTTALARAVGLPARVVVGIAVMPADGTVQAYGHAWTEVAEGGRWHVADAALATSDIEVRYVPIGVLEDEGPGYVMGSMRLLSAWVRKIVVLGPGASTS